MLVCVVRRPCWCVSYGVHVGVCRTVAMLVCVVRRPYWCVSYGVYVGVSYVVHTSESYGVYAGVC